MQDLTSTQCADDAEEKISQIGGTNLWRPLNSYDPNANESGRSLADARVYYPELGDG